MSALSIPIWSRQRATTKSTRSSIVSGTVVEARRREQDHRCPIVQGRGEPAEVDRVERRLARDQHERAPLLEGDRRGAGIRFCIAPDASVPTVRHRARADDVGVDACRPTRVRAPEVVLAVDRDLSAEPTSAPASSRERRVPVDVPSRAPRSRTARRRGRYRSRRNERVAAAAPRKGPDAPVTPRKTLTPSIRIGHGMRRREQRSEHV